jgi:signal transduction histidine kinase
MAPPDIRSQVAESIENAVAHLADALAELDRLPASDRSAVGLAARAIDSYASVAEATLALLKDALRDHPNPEVAKWLDGLGHLGRIMHHTGGRLLLATTSSEFPLKLEYIDLPLLMERACHFHQTRASAMGKPLPIIARSVGEVPLVWADRVAVAVVADSLLSNAVKFSNPGGEIVVQTVPGPGGVVCSVRDHGPGFDALEQGHVLDRAPTSESTSEPVDRATGFGLAIAKEFVNRMSGKLWAESEPGRGACFFFRLPYHPEGSTVPPRLT